MKRLFAVSRIALVLPLLAILVARVEAQAVPALENIKSQEELEKAITTLDAALFDSYNRCDLQKFSSFFVDDVEFYHDQGGVTLGRENLTDSVKKNICGKVTRELVPGTLQVHYMKGYGAVEIGVHRFPSPGARRYGGSWGRKVHSSVAIQRRRMENHAGHQLRSPRRGQVRGRQ